MTWALSLVVVIAMSDRTLLTSHARCWIVGSLPYLLCHLSRVEPEAKWPKEVLTPEMCARMPLRLAGLEVRVGVGVGVGPFVWSLVSDL